MATIDSFFPSRFLKASDLQGRPVKVTIAQVKVEQIGREGERQPVVYFRNTEKGLTLNKINAETIAEIAGSVDTEDWQGRQIVLIPAKTDFRADVWTAFGFRLRSRQEQPVLRSFHRLCLVR
jgi:hypothetical protein